MKMALLLIFIAIAVYLVRFSPVRQYVTPQQLGLFLESMGIWVPLMFVITYVVGVCLFVPGTLLTAIGAAIFGPYWGFLYVWTGAMIGSGLAFLIGRYLGRGFAASLIGDRLKRFDEAIERNGFATVLYLRLMYFPFTPMNFGMGLTKVRFFDYLLGTALGILVGTFVFTFFVGTLNSLPTLSPSCKNSATRGSIQLLKNAHSWRTRTKPNESADRLLLTGGVFGVCRRKRRAAIAAGGSCPLRLGCPLNVSRRVAKAGQYPRQSAGGAY